MCNGNIMLFQQLLDRTVDVAHGMYPLAQEDDQGALWEIIFDPWSPHLLTDASRLVPGSYTLVFGDANYLWALYRSDIFIEPLYFLIRAPAQRYYLQVLNGRYNMPARQEVYQTLSQLYGTK